MVQQLRRHSAAHAGVRQGAGLCREKCCGVLEGSCAARSKRVGDSCVCGGRRSQDSQRGRYREWGEEKTQEEVGCAKDIRDAMIEWGGMVEDKMKARPLWGLESRSGWEGGRPSASGLSDTTFTALYDVFEDLV